MILSAYLDQIKQSRGTSTLLAIICVLTRQNSFLFFSLLSSLTDLIVPIILIKQRDSTPAVEVEVEVPHEPSYPTGSLRGDSPIPP